MITFLNGIRLSSLSVAVVNHSYFYHWVCVSVKAGVAVLPIAPWSYLGSSTGDERIDVLPCAVLLHLLMRDISQGAGFIHYNIATFIYPQSEEKG